MKLIEISATAGRKFPVPNEQFANLFTSITLNATLEPSDEPIDASQKLQATADALAEMEKKRILSLHNAQPQWTSKVADKTAAKADALADKIAPLTYPVRDRNAVTA